MVADGDGDCESAAVDGAAGVGVGVERGKYFQAEVFVNETLPVALMMRQGLMSSSKSLLELCPPELLAWQHLSVEELRLLVALMWEQVAHGLGEGAFRSYSSNVMSISPALADLSLKCVESTMQVSSIMKTVNAYNGLIPSPRLMPSCKPTSSCNGNGVSVLFIVPTNAFAGLGFGDQVL